MMINATFTNNFALRASLFFTFNSQTELFISKGSASRNGIVYHKSLRNVVSDPQLAIEKKI
jgi:hypothetical protein